MKVSKYSLCMLIALQLVTFGEVLSQQVKSSSSFFTDRCNTVSEEIAITVFGSGGVTEKVTNLETLSSTSDDITASTNHRAPQCDWTANTEGQLELPYPTRDLDPDTPYKIEFKGDDESVKHTLLYLQCTENTDLSIYSFYCPFGVQGGFQNDLFIDYYPATDEIDILPSGFFDLSSPVGIDDVIGSDNWLLPMHQYLIDPVSTARIGYFLAAQIPTSLQNGPFNVHSDDLTLAAGFNWSFDDVELRFQSGTQFIVEGDLTTENTAFTSNNNWGGIEFKDGSEATLTNVDILKVGSGAYTGSFTVRDGADVTVLTDSDNIVLGPNFKAELGSTFLASYVSGSSSAEQGPAPEFVLDEHDQEGDATGDRNPGTSALIVAESYPNPFNPSTQIRYQLSADAQVSLKLYNVLGQELRTLVSEFQSAGTWAFTWDGRDGAGSMVPSGTYLYRITAGDEIQSGQMVLVK